MGLNVACDPRLIEYFRINTTRLFIQSPQGEIERRAVGAFIVPEESIYDLQLGEIRHGSNGSVVYRELSIPCSEYEWIPVIYVFV